MNKMMIPLAMTGLMLCGCLSTDTYRDGDIDPQRGLQDNSANPYVIDYKIRPQRVKGKGRSDCWCWFFASNDGRHMTAPGFTFDSSVRSAKESATFDAVAAAKADTMVGAIYTYTQNSTWLGFHKWVECEVIGFPADVAGVEKVESRPVLLKKDEQVIRVKPWEKL